MVSFWYLENILKKEETIFKLGLILGTTKNILGKKGTILQSWFNKNYLGFFWDKQTFLQKSPNSKSPNFEKTLDVEKTLVVEKTIHYTCHYEANIFSTNCIYIQSKFLPKEPKNIPLDGGRQVETNSNWINTRWQPRRSTRWNTISYSSSPVTKQQKVQLLKSHTNLGTFRA